MSHFINSKNRYEMIYKSQIIRQNIPKTLNIFCQINKYKIHEIIDIIFIHCCCLDVYGYNSLNDEFWGKKKDAYFKLNIKKHKENISIISLIPLIYNEKLIKEIYKQIIESINIYENTFC